MATLNQILFPVSNVSVSDYFGVNAIKSAEKAIIGNINGKDTLIQTCSNRYELVPNEKIFLPIENKLAGAGLNYSATYSMVNNSIFKAKYVVNDIYVSIGNEKIFLQIYVTHSYNGLVKYKLMMGFFRLVCTNGLVIPAKGTENQSLSITGKHTASIIESIDQLNCLIDQFTDNTDIYVSYYDRMISKKFDGSNLDAIIETTFQKTGIKKGHGESNFNAVINVVRKELTLRKLHTDYNAFLVYNAINEGYVYNNNLNKITDPLRLELDQKVVNYLYYDLKV